MEHDTVILIFKAHRTKAFKKQNQASGYLVKGVLNTEVCLCINSSFPT